MHVNEVKVFEQEPFIDEIMKLKLIVSLFCLFQLPGD